MRRRRAAWHSNDLAHLSRSGGNVDVSFAIPIDVAMQFVAELEENGHVTRAWLGVTVVDLAQALGIEQAIGALVAARLLQRPAPKAAIEPGDVITRYDGTALKGESALPNARRLHAE